MAIAIVGISDQQAPILSDEVTSLIKSHRYFAGGERHYELIKSLLPLDYCWSTIVVPLAPFVDMLRRSEFDWVVFASGDPLFFGIANTLKRELPEASISVFPTFNSLQMLAHKALLPYGTAKMVTLTGRPWSGLDKALIDNESLIAVLTDKVHTPITIAQRMLKFGYDGYKMVLGERLGGPLERVRWLTLTEATNTSFEHPNALYLVKIDDRKLSIGIPDDQFHILEGRPKMMTKMAIRLASIAALEIKTRKVLWDVGACTGSISIEAKLANPLLDVHSFEVREESDAIISANAKKFGTPLSIYIGDFCQTVTDTIARPDAIFLGGYGGKMDQVLDHADQYLLEDGVITFNAVSDSSKSQFLDWSMAHGYKLLSQSTIKVDDHNPIVILTIQKITANS